MREVRFCPLLKITKEVDGKKVEEFQFCRKEECMMYNYGVCALSNKEKPTHY